MNDENDKPKDNDWGMTMPHMRYEDERKANNSSDDFAPPVNRTPNRAADDEWGMTTPNLEIPNDYSSSSDAADFDKTTPNFNLPKDIWEAKAPPLDPLPVDNRETNAANADVPTESGGWEMDAPNFNPPPSPPKSNWSMPAPVFRVSEGENIEDIKKTAAFKLSDLQGFDADSMTFKSPADAPPDTFDKTAPNIKFQESAPTSAPIDSQESTPPVVSSPSAPKKAASSKIPLIVGGIFTMLMFAGVLLTGIYFLLINKPNETASKSESSTTQPAENFDTVVAPSSPLSIAPTNENLPAQIEYQGAMVLVAAGKFTMGSDAGADESKPAHEVSLPAFYIDRTEVSNAEYKKFCDATGKSYPTNPHIETNYFTARPNAPVVGVSFADAKAYADWAGKRLPTEDEWEKAASWDEKARTKREFPWGNDFQKDKSAFQTPKISDVGKFSDGASASGALDMAGNVLEWVDAFFQPYPNGASSNPEFGEINRVVRGGHFASKSSDSLKTTKRIYIPPTVASGEDDEKLVAAIIGFRCAVSADDSRMSGVLGKQGK